MGGDKASKLEYLGYKVPVLYRATNAEVQTLCLDDDYCFSWHTSCQKRSGEQTAKECIKACGVGGVTVERDSGCRMTMTSSKTRTSEIEG